MIISIWRYSHLILAVSSFILLTLASVTGIILAVEPIQEKSQSAYQVLNPGQLKLSELISSIEKEKIQAQKITISDHDFIILEWTDKNKDARKSYIDPRSAQVLGEVKPQSDFFKWITALHRSLFIHETGRFLVGFSAFLLMLIVISGIILVLQRQKSLSRFFARVEKDNWSQYYHVVFGRVMLIPIFFIAITGAYLSVARFGWIDAEEAKLNLNTDNIREEPQIAWESFPLFNETPLSEIQTVEFPFSEFPEDYFTVRLKDRVVAVNQFNGEMLGEQRFSNATKLNSFSLRWHTGRSGIVWAIILSIGSGYILFFIFSGFVITFRRRANRVKNKFSAEESTIVILAGSENGSTLGFAKSVYKQMVSQGEKVFLTDPDNYRLFPRMEKLIVFMSTYGLGDPPTNAKHFISRLTKFPQQQQVHFSVVAFGSRSYSDFCKFGIETDELLGNQKWTTRELELFTVNDRSPQDFETWCTSWSKKNTNILIVPEENLLHQKLQHLSNFTVVHKTEVQQEQGSFQIRVQKPGNLQVQSGDLLAVYPANDHRERLYSIGAVDNEIQLSVKHYNEGLGSSYLYGFSEGDELKGRIIKNQHFHFPKKAPEIIMISNGTGIAPFLGMIDENKRKKPVHLYCGFRFNTSFEPYREFLGKKQTEGFLTSLHLALSREGNCLYVNQLLERDAAVIASSLRNGAVIMICGSLALQKDVLTILQSICNTDKSLDFEMLKTKGRIVTDCY